MENIVELTNVKKVYRMGEERVLALDNINLQIGKGEICCLLGTSGSGKSTLLNLMAGLEKPTKGEIKVRNHNVEKLNERQLAKLRQKYIGFVFQSYNLLEHLTALENVTMPLIFKGIPKKKRENRAKEMLKAVGLESRMNHKPSQMSGGQQQRVSIARAFITNPEIVFADEPTGNLDSKTTEDIMELIVGMAEEHNQTLVIVTHDTEISRYANKIIRIKDGCIEKIVTKNEKGERVIV
jgi:putative ABC transport system ATP-binding protein